MPNKRHIWKIAIPTLLTGWLIFVTWPRPSYELYVSPPLDDAGIRVQFFIPQAWTESVQRVSLYPMTWIEFHPPERPSWWPAFLRKWFRPLNPATNSLMVGICNWSCE